MDCMTDADPLCEMGFDNVIDECNPGLACDNIPDDWLPWMQDGTCLTDSSCDTVGIVAINYASGFYEDNCTLAVSGSMCDSSVLNGNFLHNGYCLDNDNCDIDDEVVMDCDSNGNNICEIGIDPVYDECINHAGDACDSNTTDSSEWRQNGTCTSTSCDTEGEIAFQESTGSFLDDCATAGSGYICDSNILEGDFDDSGYCLSNDDCSTQQLTSMYCNATGTFDCELVIDTVVDGCTPGRACDMTPGTGTPWNQDGTCLSDLSCDDDTEVAFNGSDYFSDCLDLGVGALCDNYAVSGGDFNPIGQCTIPNPSLGLCDIELPVVTRIEVNTSDYGWGNEITELLCFNATDDSGILHNNYSFQYTTDDSGSNGWTDISGCTATTEQCIWNTSDIIFDRTTWVRCRAMDLAEQYSNFTNTSFNGIDTILPAVTLIEPQNNYIWDHSLTVNFTYFIDENLNLTNCSLLINDSVVKTVDNMTNGTINQFRYALVKGDYTWNVHCHDIADNTGKGDKRNITSIIYEAIFVNNMGVVGFDMTNPEYTYSEAVWLELYFHTTNTGCRYMNQGGAWTYWQQCESMKFWSLTPGEGLKTVFYQINHSDHEFTLLNDSITLIYSGAGLDTTPPSAPEVTDDGNFTNDNSTLHAVWTRSYDHESEILGIPIYYEYKVDNTIYDSWTRTSEIEITLENLTLNEGRNYVFDVRAVNSANLTNESQSDGITVDITAPDITSVWSTTHPNPGMWYPERDVILSWNGSDAIAGISGFSFVLDDHNDTTPGDLSIDLTTKIYQDLADSIYYFHIKAADAADNFGDTSHFRIAIDTSRPTKPEFINITFNSSSNEVFFQWTESVDEESGIMQYELNITEGGSSTIYTTTDTTITVSVNSGNEYYAKVRSRNWANQTSVYSDEEERIDTTPPTIISQLPTNGADVSTDEARLILRTDEKAICRYDNSTDFVDFIFTNSLHHETKMGLEPGSYSYSIRCTDMFGNSATNQMSFSTTEQLAGSIEIISTDARFSRKIATADVEVQNSLEGITKERWGVRIGDQPIDFSAADMGSGNYRITFETPDKPGTFTLTVISDSGSDSAEIEITKPLLNIEFTGSELKPIDLNRVVYLKEEDYAVGIATESRIANIGSNDDSISISSDNKDQSYIFMTKRSANIANKEDYLKQMEFIELINPSFGYLITDEYTIIDKLSYDNIEIKGSVNLFPGYYNLEITNKGYDLEGKKIVEIRITEEDKKQEIIIQHE